MSDNQKLEKSGNSEKRLQLRRDLSPAGSGATRNKFALNQVVGEQLESIRKLSELATTNDKLKPTSLTVTELNNNTIDPNEENTLKSNIISYNNSPNNNMVDSNKKPTPAFTTSKQAAHESSFNHAPAPDLVGLRLAHQPDLPLSYTSIFAQKPTSGRANSRASQLRKQSEIEVACAGRLPSIDRHLSLGNKRLLDGYSAASTHSQRAEEDEEEDERDEDDEEEEDEQQVDERIPFNSSSNKLRNNRKRLSLDRKMSRQASPSGAGKPSVLAFDNKCEMNSQRHMRISLADCRPPSFNTCQSSQWNHQQHHQSTTCIKCDCSNCYKKFNSAVVIDGNFGQAIKKIPPNETMYPKTYSFHMVLKSIILILLTLLLLMLFFGILMVSHHLPKAIERMVNTPHSFNVTIAGR